MATGNAVLFSEMTPDPSWEHEFNDWYDREHIPLRMNVPGFCGAQRYRADTGHGYAVVYEMDSPEVRTSIVSFGKVSRRIRLRASVLSSTVTL